MAEHLLSVPFRNEVTQERSPLGSTDFPRHLQKIKCEKKIRAVADQRCLPKSRFASKLFDQKL